MKVKVGKILYGSINKEGQVSTVMEVIKPDGSMEIREVMGSWTHLNGPTELLDKVINND